MQMGKCIHLHLRDNEYPPWHASTYEYAERLLRAITDKHPELRDVLTIRVVDEQCNVKSE
jgi:hypothetical protein